MALGLEQRLERKQDTCLQNVCPYLNASDRISSAKCTRLSNTEKKRMLVRIEKKNNCTGTTPFYMVLGVVVLAMRILSTLRCRGRALNKGKHPFAQLVSAWKSS